MFKKLIIGLIALTSMQTLVAQADATADKLLNDLLNSAKTAAIRTNFKLELTIKADPRPQTSTGSFILRGNKFVLDMTQMKVWFNGKTQWAFSAQSNEVSITEPTEKELAETNPLAIIASFRAKSITRMVAKNKNPQSSVIEMIPANKKSEISKIEITLSKASGNPVQIKTMYLNGSTSLLKLNSFERGVNVSDNLFSFNAAKFKGVNINDLR